MCDLAIKQHNTTTAGCNILLVEEELMLADAIRVLLLDDLDCEIDIVTNLPKLESYLKTKTPDIILIDLTFPDTCPHDFVTYINQIRGQAHLILSTASSRLIQNLEDLVDAMLKKPFSIDQLTHLIRTFQN